MGIAKEQEVMTCFLALRSTPHLGVVFVLAQNDLGRHVDRRAHPGFGRGVELMLQEHRGVSHNPYLLPGFVL